MSHYDATTKHLVEAAPADWLALCGIEVHSPVHVIDADLSTVSSMADKLVMIGPPEPWMVHFEFQASYDSSIGLRLLRYNVMIEFRHGRPVLSILILLKPESDGPAARGIIRRSLPSGWCYDEFHFQTVRVWQLPVDELLQGRIGTLPLAPISDVGVPQLPGVLRRMQARVESEVPVVERADFWTATAILLGSRYPFEIVESLIRGVTQMRESSVIQHFLARRTRRRTRRRIFRRA